MINSREICSVDEIKKNKFRFVYVKKSDTRLKSENLHP